MSFCPYCGAPFSSGNFCIRCGNRVYFQPNAQNPMPSVAQQPSPAPAPPQTAYIQQPQSGYYAQSGQPVYVQPPVQQPVQPQANVYAQPQPNAYAQPQPNVYAQPQPNAYAQPQPNAYTQPQPIYIYAQPAPAPAPAPAKAKKKNGFPVLALIFMSIALLFRLTSFADVEVPDISEIFSAVGLAAMVTGIALHKMKLPYLISAGCVISLLGNAINIILWFSSLTYRVLGVTFLIAVILEFIAFGAVAYGYFCKKKVLSKVVRCVGAGVLIIASYALYLAVSNYEVATDYYSSVALFVTIPRSVAFILYDPIFKNASNNENNTQKSFDNTNNQSKSEGDNTL